ncbi:MAG: MarR family winged helix-turn-helix transcriptional regulator [Longibaculum sp.]
MDYQEYAKELIDYMGANEKTGKIVQYNISEIKRGEVAVLLFLIDEKNGASAGEISHKLDVNTSRVAAILNSLSRKGYIKRMGDDNDKRKIRVYITESGETFAKERRNEIIGHVSEMLKMLGEKDTQEYIRICKKISNFVKMKI